MMFESNDREPGEELEDFGDELSSDYREEEEDLDGDEGDMPEHEISYEVEETAEKPLEIVLPTPPPAPAVPARRAPSVRKPVKKALKPAKKAARKPAKKTKPAKKARPTKKAKPAKKSRKAKKPAKAKGKAGRKKSRRR